MLSNSESKEIPMYYINCIYNKYIQKYINLYKNTENLTLDFLREECSHNLNDPIKMLAIGTLAKKISPCHHYGYSICFDAFFRLDEDYLSLAQVQEYLQKCKSIHIQLLKRLVRRYFDSYQLSKIHEVVKDNLKIVLKNIDKNIKFIDELKDILFFISDIELLKKIYPNCQYDELNSIDDFLTNHSDEQITNYITKHYYTVVAKNSEQNYQLNNFVMRMFFLNKINKQNIKMVIGCLLNNESEKHILNFMLMLNSNMDLNSENVLRSSTILMGAGEYNESLSVLEKYFNESSSVVDYTHVLLLIKVMLRSGRGNDLYMRLLNLLSNCKLTNKAKQFIKYRLNINMNKDSISNGFLLESSTTPKVAVCLSGQLRTSLAPVYDGFIKHIKNEKSIFLSTWDYKNVNFENLKFRGMVRRLGKKLTKLLPKELRISNNFKKYLPKTFDKLTCPVKQIIDFSKVRKEIDDNLLINVESEDNFTSSLPDNLKVSTVKMFFHNQQSFRFTNYAFDVYIRCRTDFLFSLPNINELIQIAYDNPNLIFVYYTPTLGICDQFAIGSYHAMKVYNDVYNKIIQNGKLSYSEFFSENSIKGAEFLLSDHLALYDLTIKSIRLNGKKIQLQEPPINSIDISKELEEDLYSSKDPEIFNDFKQCYYSIKHKNGKFI